MSEDQQRELEATLAAHTTLIHTLLMWSFDDFTSDQIVALGAHVKNLANDISIYEGVTKDDEAASERLADIIVRKQAKIATLIEGAVENALLAHGQTRA